MPHLVASLFRSSSHSLESSNNNNNNNITTKPSSSSSRRHRPSFTSRRSSFSAGSRTSSDDLPPPTEEPTISRSALSKMPGSQKEPHHHRLSFSLHLGRSLHVSPPPPPPPAELDWELETPPVMLHGRPDESAGALLSGLVKLEVKADQLDITSCRAALAVRVTHKRPFQPHCKECESQTTVLKSFEFLPESLSGPLPMKKGVHSFPFSLLVAGHLPASMDCPLGSISYSFTTTAVAASGETIKMEKAVPVRRCIPESHQEHHSVRVFPPTNIAANLHYPTVIHPSRDNTLRLHMNGLSSINQDGTKHPRAEFWKLKKMSWRLDETVRMIAPACDKHTPRPVGGSATRKGLQRSETRTIGSAELTEGWKAVYDPKDSEMEVELQYSVKPPRRGPRPVCDLKANDGTEVLHSLIIEMVVVQEVAPLNQPSLCQPTGTARILRMHFNTILTEESAEGEVSWDCEAPPVYEDVPPSPPAYPAEETSCHGDELQTLERQTSNDGCLATLTGPFENMGPEASPSILEGRGSSDGGAPSFS